MKSLRWLAIGIGILFVLAISLGIWQFVILPQTAPLTVDEIPRRWGESLAAIRTIRGSQTFSVVAADGSLQPQPHSEELRYGTILSTEEIVSIDSKDRRDARIRYHFREHTTRGDVVMGWDGERAYKYVSWANEVYYPLPEGPAYGMNAYWLDDAGDRSIFELLTPSMQDNLVNPIYDLIGAQELEGRQVLELVVKPGNNSAPNGVEGNHIFIDASTFLPFRKIGSGLPARVLPNQPTYVVTANQLIINPTLADQDFRIEVPPNAHVIYEAAPFAPPLESFATAQEAASSVDYTLYLPPLAKIQQIRSLYLIEKDGKRHPVLAIHGDSSKGPFSLVQGVYLPSTITMVNEKHEPPRSVFVNGNPATLYVTCCGGAQLFMERDGTQIQVFGSIEENEVISIAEALVPVE